MDLSLYQWTWTQYQQIGWPLTRPVILPLLMMSASLLAPFYVEIALLNELQKAHSNTGLLVFYVLLQMACLGFFLVFAWQVSVWIGGIIPASFSTSAQQAEASYQEALCWINKYRKPYVYLLVLISVPWLVPYLPMMLASVVSLNSGSAFTAVSGLWVSMGVLSSLLAGLGLFVILAWSLALQDWVMHHGKKPVLTVLRDCMILFKKHWLNLSVFNVVAFMVSNFLIPVGAGIVLKIMQVNRFLEWVLTPIFQWMTPLMMSIFSGQFAAVQHLAAEPRLSPLVSPVLNQLFSGDLLQSIMVSAAASTILGLVFTVLALPLLSIAYTRLYQELTDSSLFQ